MFQYFNIYCKYYLHNRIFELDNLIIFEYLATPTLIAAANYDMPDPYAVFGNKIIGKKIAENK